MKWVAARKRELRQTWTRKTIRLSAEALQIVDYLRSTGDCSASEAIDQLILRTEPQKPRIKYVNGLAVFDIQDDGPPITLEDIQRMHDEEFIYPRKTHKPTPSKTSCYISPEALVIVKQIQENQDLSLNAAISNLIEQSR